MQNQQQLTLIREIVSLFRINSIDFWLRGGWAIDFMLGKITRTHSDIDIVAWKKDSTQIRQILVSAGYSFQRDIAVQMDFSKQDHDVSVVYIGKNDKGQIFTPDIPDWVWLDTALSYAPQTLESITSQVVAPEQLLANKLSYQSATGRALRPKDQQSMAILRQIIGS